MNNLEWRKSGKYLPDVMRDFHDQKEIFKTIFERYSDIEDVSMTWIDAHIFTIDFFLWFMAEHGYTLQKNRSRVEFCDLHNTLSLSREDKIKTFSSLLGSIQPKSD